uniref:Uncharacterized protein n=1 Tax=Engystomops pustulosus TaxID=76066 RepID=A0AAV6YE11_ENGPU|nr:hypothetical protein GDO81_029722 [Engystomops pustulosus]
MAGAGPMTTNTSRHIGSVAMPMLTAAQDLFLPVSALTVSLLRGCYVTTSSIGLRGATRKEFLKIGKDRQRIYHQFSYINVTHTRHPVNLNNFFIFLCTVPYVLLFL